MNNLNNKEFIREKKLRKIKTEKINKHLIRLENYVKKPRVYFEVLLACFIGSFIFIVISMVLLSVIKNITPPDGTKLSSNVFWVDSATYKDPNKIPAYEFNFGIYHYIFHIKPLTNDKSSVTLATMLATIMKSIINHTIIYQGPDLNWYGIVYVIFEIFLVSFALTTVTIFAIYNKSLKLTKKGLKVWNYFIASYSLVIIFIILSSTVVEVNFVPSQKMLINLVEHSKSTSIPTFPTIVSAFGLINFQTIKQNNDTYLLINFLLAKQAYALIIVMGIFLITLLVLFGFIFINYKNHKALVDLLTNNDEFKSIIENTKNNNLNPINVAV